MDALQDEVESLEAILMDDVQITKNSQTGVPEAIETTVFDESEQQSICVTLQVLPPPGYPDVSPDFKLLRPRGLDDSRLEAIKSACLAKIQESVGFPIVFDLIEVVREHLTGSNLPSGQCVICLYGFSDGDEFTRTECFHYLHSYCLGRHLNALRRNYQEEYDKLPAWLQKTADTFQAGCPVCREPIKDESDSLKCAMPPEELQNAPDFKLTRELRELQQRMSSLFLQQKSRGAIIDVEAESGTVISIETEAEIRRRTQRKKNNGTTAAVAASEESGSCNVASGDENAAAGRNSACDTYESTEQMVSGSSKSSSSSTNFSTVAQPQQRVVNDPTNNNYQHQHNRRHYRGGRRHQHHHHHNRDRERNHHVSSHHQSNSSTGAAGAASAPASGVENASGKHAKAQAAGGTHFR